MENNQVKVETKEKKSSVLVLIIVAIIIVIGVGVIFLVPGVKDKIPIIGNGLSQKWANAYYDWVMEGKEKLEFEGVKTSKVYFLGEEAHPIMFIIGEKDGKANNYIVYQQEQDYKAYGVMTKTGVDLYYDSIYDDFGYFNCYRAELNNQKYDDCEHLSKYHNYGDNRKPDFFFYDNGTFEIHNIEKIQKKSNTKKEQVLIKIDDTLYKADFDIQGSDSEIKAAIKEAADNFKPLENIETEEMKTESKKKIEENKKKAQTNNKKNTQSQSSSSSSSSIGQSTNPCDVIERKNCPSGFQLICSMEWCEKKEYVNKSECNDNLAKKYGTPVKGQTEWSSYYNACIINIEATK